jgi:hypothetical protein
MPDCNVPILKSGDRLIMFDVGSGPNFMPSAGKSAGEYELMPDLIPRTSPMWSLPTATPTIFGG